METKENTKPCDKDTGAAEGAGNPEAGHETSPSQEAAEGHPGPQSGGEGNMDFQPGPVPGQMPFPYGYFQSPNLHPGYYMAQGGFLQGPMPGYWMPPGYGAPPPYMYMQPGPAAPQGTGQAGGWSDPGNPGSQQPQGQPGGAAQPANPGQFQAHDAAGSQDNPGLQAHDAPGTTGSEGNAGHGPRDKANGLGSAPGHHKEPSHDELKYGTYMETPSREAFEDAPEMAGDVSPPSGLASFFQLENDSFWKGILVGSLATLLLTSSTVKKGIMKTAIKASASVKGGIEELKEQLADVEAEVLHELNEKKK